MKNNKVLIIIAVLLLNVLVAFMISQSLLGKESEFDKTLAQARAFSENELCGRAIEKYNEALLMEDTLDLRLEMFGVYEKGINIGEFSNTYDIFNFATSTVDAYRKDVRAYEAACELLLKYDRCEECADILMTARDLYITSDKIEEYRSEVRYRYTEYFSMYTEVMPTFNGMYAVKTEDGYTYLSDEGSVDIDGNFIYASSFSEGYAFVKTIGPDGAERSIIINKDGQRQAYLDGVETSSGVGGAKNGDGENIYLLAGKTGERYKYYDIDGKEVFGDYKFAGRFRNNVAAVEESEGVWKLIDGTGTAIVDTAFSDVILNEFDECAPKGLIIAKIADDYRVYDLKGEQIGDFACEDAKAFVDEYAAFKKSGLWGFVDSTGKVIIEPQYEDAKSFSNSMGAVNSGGAWSFINPKNEVVIQRVFEDVDYLNDKGVCFVKEDGYWSYLKMYYTGE